MHVKFISEAKKNVIASNQIPKIFAEKVFGRYKNSLGSKDSIEWLGKNSNRWKTSGALFGTVDRAFREKNVDTNGVHCCARRPIPRMP
jgi:hypothetical protein